MKTKVILYINETKMIYDSDNVYIGTLASEPVLYVEQTSRAEVTLQLIKAGVSPDDVINLARSDLL